MLKSKPEEYKKLPSPKSPDNSSTKKSYISIFIKNDLGGQHQEQKQDKKDESQNGCMAWIKSLCK